MLAIETHAIPNGVDRSLLLTKGAMPTGQSLNQL